MGFLDFANGLKQAIEAINETREEESILIGTELTALVRLRVQNDKINSQGISFGLYSPAWAKIREDNNQPTDAINFTFSGDMWRNTGVTGVDNTNASTTIKIGGQTTRAQLIQEGQSVRHGNIIEPNEQEIEFVIEAHTERIFGIINKFL